MMLKIDFSRYALLAIFLITPILLAGCGGSDRLAVQGKVSFDGEPVEYGQVRFTPLSGTKGPTGGAKIKNGVYEVASAKGLFKGNYRVELQAWKRIGNFSIDQVTGEKTEGGDLRPFLPAKYNEDSELTVEVASGKQTHDFNLEP